MNPEQTKTFARWVISTFGGIITGFAVGKNWITADRAAAILSDPTVLAIVGSIIAGVWGWISRSDKNLVASVNALPNVAGVVTMPTPEGRALAASVPDATVATAGTAAATSIAKA